MPTLSQLVFDIQNIASSGKENYSLRVESQQISFWVSEARAKFINEAIQRRESLSDVWVQSINCLEMELVDKSECCFIETKCFILKSKKKLPNTIEYFNDNTIIRVTTADGTIINKSNPFKQKFNSFNKYTKDKSFWFLQNGYLYIINEVLIDYVDVFGIFDNPEELSDFVNCSGQTCFSWEDPYPISNKMANDVTNYVVRSKILPFYSTIPDTSNNANNESGTINPNGLIQK